MRSVKREECPIILSGIPAGFGEPKREKIEAAFVPVYQKKKPVPESAVAGMPRAERPKEIFCMCSRGPKRTHRREIACGIVLCKRPDIEIRRKSGCGKKSREKTQATTPHHVSHLQNSASAHFPVVHERASSRATRSASRTDSIESHGISGAFSTAYDTRRTISV